MSNLNSAVIGNCSIASLISATGRHVWFCFPRLDSNPIFSALIDGNDTEHGFMDVVSADLSTWTQRYIPNTAILETVGSNAQGDKLKIIDFAPRHEKFGRSFHPALLVRRIEPISGRPSIRVRIRPMFDYGKTVPAVATGSNHIRYSAPGTQTLRVTADMPISYLTEETEFVLDRPIHIFLGNDETVLESLDVLATNLFAETEAYWCRWVRGLSIPFEWQANVIRSAITLKLCSFEDTGAIVAALTASIPEAPNSGHNWDYRYCWLRDDYFAVGTLNRLGTTRTMESFIRFILDAVLANQKQSHIAPLFSISGSGEMTESIASALKGYRGMGAVRIGNGASIQVQNDTYGSIVLTAAQMFWDQRISHADHLPLSKQLVEVGHTASRRALEPDSGPWEYRDRSVVHTYSAAMCWAGVHRLAMFAKKLGRTDEADEWNAQARQIRSAILSRATTRENWLSGTLDAEIADASTLLLTEIGFPEVTDERVTKTLDVVSKQLMRDGFVYRYCEADDFGEPETAFMVCTFWHCDALGLARRKPEARELFESEIACRNSVGLLSEDFAPGTRELWGNFPQACSHVGLIHSAWRLSRGREEASWRAS